jgi:hypothetical protein
MNEGQGMAEQLMPFRRFIQTYLMASTKRGIWSLPLMTECDDMTPLSSVAYLAQHPLLRQIPAFSEGTDLCPAICGALGPEKVNAWIGTGGTRTPLHYDSMDNIFVQIVGIKYVRIYTADQTPNLYVLQSGSDDDSKVSSYAKQGNMSALDCEREDWAKHPDAANAKYTEALLFPGDTLFIPKGAWHYVRSLTTSFSGNYWF